MTVQVTKLHPTFHSEERLVNLVRGRECFVGLSMILVYVANLGGAHPDGHPESLEHLVHPPPHQVQPHHPLLLTSTHHLHTASLQHGEQNV